MLKQFLKDLQTTTDNTNNEIEDKFQEENDTNSGNRKEIILFEDLNAR